MPYYDTIEEDLTRAKEILARGKMGASDFHGSPLEDTPEGRVIARRMIAESGTIYGMDIYAAYKLLESFVEHIERKEP